jgi:excisionase family DNA binding protein
VPVIGQMKESGISLGGAMDTSSQIHEVRTGGNVFEPLLTAEEAADHLRMHPKTLQKLARGEHVPAIRIGRNWYFRLSALDAWVRSIENRCSQPFCVK